MSLPEQLMIDGVRYQRIDRQANRLGAHLMYDCHGFRRCHGLTVKEIVADWQEEHDSPGKHGSPSLCPMIVLEGTKELRRVGEMVHAVYDFSGAEVYERQAKALKQWITACEGDPDIPRLLAAGRNCDR